MAYELKTKLNDSKVSDFLDTIENQEKRQDCYTIADIMQEVSGFDAKMWGTSIVGFGSYRYKYESGHEGEMCLIGFSPRKANITIYGMGSQLDKESLRDKLGKHKTGKGCLYINKLSDINTDTLRKLLKASLEQSKKQ
jgi:hypothetical protein